jgi:RNA polymerase sigma-70 factor, ECF subfamily
MRGNSPIRRSGQAGTGFVSLPAELETFVQQFHFDETYMSGLQNGDPAVEADFASAFRSPCLSVARNKLRRILPHLVEDAAQDTLMRALLFFRAGGCLNDPKCLPSFVLAICRNVCMEYIRKYSRFQPIPDPDLPDDRYNIFDAMEEREKRAIVLRALRDLPERDRQLVLAVLVEGADREELCRRFNVTRDNLRTVVCRAVKRLREALAEYLKRAEPQDNDA